MSNFTLSVLLPLVIFLFAIRGVISARSGEDLVDLINDWRARKGKSRIPKSSKLFKVANAHTTNQCVSSYKGRQQQCWNPHSWEDVDNFRYDCCYEPSRGTTWDCMWEKPYQIARWDVDGYEVSAGGTSPASALNAWERSSKHTDVILNTGTWKYKTWKAIGCAGAPDRHRHWNCWFASESDNSRYYYQGEPDDCDGGHWGSNIWGDAFEVDEDDAPAIHNVNDEKKGNGSDTMIVWIICCALLLVTVSGVIIYLCLKKNRNAKGVKVQDEEIEDDEGEVEEEEECVIECETTIPVITAQN